MKEPDFDIKTIWHSSKSNKRHPVLITAEFADDSDDWDLHPTYIAELSIFWDGENIFSLVPQEDLDELADEIKDAYESYVSLQKQWNETDFIEPKHITSWSF